VTDWHLGIDFGSGQIVTAIATVSGARGMGSGRAAIPPTVYLADDGTLLVSEDAIPAGLARPERAVAMVDRLVGTREPIFPGLSPATAHDALTTLFRWVLRGATNEQAGSPTSVSVAYPTRWRAERRRALAEAANMAGAQGAELVPASSAAAHRLAATHRPGDAVAVYLLGATQCEVVVLRRIVTGWVSLTRTRALDLGAVDLDRQLLEYVLKQGSERDRGVTADGLEAARRAREELSQRPTAVVDVGDGAPSRLTRDEVDELFAPLLEPSIDLLVASVETAVETPDGLSGVVVTGAASAYPLVDRLVSDALGRAPSASDERHADVAIGAAELSLSNAMLPQLRPLVPPRREAPQHEVPAARIDVGPAIQRGERVAQQRPEQLPGAAVGARTGYSRRLPVPANAAADPARLNEAFPEPEAVAPLPPIRDDRRFRPTVVRPIAPVGQVADQPRGEMHQTLPREPESRRLVRLIAIVAVAALVVVVLYVLAYPGVI
jgi:hypothetical protein